MSTADSYQRSVGVKKSPIYTRVTDPDRYMRGNSTNTQEMRKADAADKIIADRYGVLKTDLNTPAQIAADEALQEPNAFTTAAAGLGDLGGSGGSGNYGSNIDMLRLNEDKRQFNLTNGLNQSKWDAEQAQGVQSRADAQARLQAMQNYYDTGGYKTGYDELSNIATGQYDTGVQGVQGTYDRAQENLGAGFDMAQGLTNKGYAFLQNYLQQNPNNAFAGLQQQVQPVANPMQQFLSAYGVDNAPVQAQVGAEQLAGQQGAGAFNTLADILNRNSQQSDASRMAEMQMGQTMANSGLGAQRANYQAQNAQAQAQALAQLKQQLQQQQFGIQQNQMQAGQDIYNQILAATGDYGQNDGNGDSVPPDAMQSLQDYLSGLGNIGGFVGTR
jgi:hypothetical protein